MLFIEQFADASAFMSAADHFGQHRPDRQHGHIRQKALFRLIDRVGHDDLSQIQTGQAIKGLLIKEGMRKREIDVFCAIIP